METPERIFIEHSPWSTVYIAIRELKAKMKQEPLKTADDYLSTMTFLDGLKDTEGINPAAKVFIDEEKAILAENNPELHEEACQIIEAQLEVM